MIMDDISNGPPYRGWSKRAFAPHGTWDKEPKMFSKPEGAT